MIFTAIKDSPSFKKIADDILFSLNHAYLFYSFDEALNNNFAQLFAMAVLCENQNLCLDCNNCKRILLNTHPDVKILDKPKILVEDVSELIYLSTLKPMIADKKVFIILNAGNMSAICQNKLLKTLEEPPQNTIFLLTETDLSKLLPTVVSRLKKHQCELDNLNFLPDASQINLTDNVNLSDYLKFSQSDQYRRIILQVQNLIENLDKSASIPALVSNLNLKTQEKTLFFQIMESFFKNLLKFYSGLPYNEVWADCINKVANQYSVKAINKILLLLQISYKNFCANVNFNYVCDLLLFNILKERFLCS